MSWAPGCSHRLRPRQNSSIDADYQPEETILRLSSGLKHDATAQWGEGMFNWKEEYKTGNGAIDLQHLRLFELGTQVHEMLSQKRGDDKYDDLVVLLKELRDYTVYHFDFEEGMLEAVGYPQLEQHQAEHRRFVEKLDELATQDLDVFQNKVAFEMLGFLANWIERHILDSDFRYAEYV